MRAPRLLASGIGFTEGPLWTANGRLLVVSVSRGSVYEVDLGGGGVLNRVETGGGPNGLAEDGGGRVWVAQNGGGAMATRSALPVVPGLQRIDGGQTVRALDVGEVQAPNDLVQGPDGRVWFTDPGGPSNPGPGFVRAHDPDTGVTEILADGIEYPNGLVWDRSGQLLYVAETRTGRILRYSWDASRLEPDGVLATVRDGGADGLALGAEGMLYAAIPRADMIAVLAPDGTPLEPVRFTEPSFPTNLCFAGADSDVLVVTAAKGGRVFALDGVARGFGPLPSFPAIAGR